MPAVAASLLRVVRVADLVGNADPQWQVDPSLVIPTNIIANLSMAVGEGAYRPRGVKVLYGWTDAGGNSVADSGTMTLQLLELASLPYSGAGAQTQPGGSTTVPLVSARDVCTFELPAGQFTVRVSSVAPDVAEFFQIFWWTY